MPIQAPQWTDYLNCPVCCREFGAPTRSPISLGCGHTLCRHCLKHLHRKQCPFDQTVIQVEPEELVVNTALLQLAGYAPPAQPYHPPCIQALPERDRHAYDVIVRCMEHLAVYLKFCGNSANNSMTGSRLSRPMQRKLVTLLQCAMTDEEGRGRAARAARSLGERTVTELILQHQNAQQLSANLWAAVRARGCQFLGPAMQEEVLKLVLLALEDGSALSRKVLVMFVVQRLEPHFPQASKTSIGHVVQLLYRASCFKVSKRECDSSLMQLKEEFRTYEALRREHDAQIVQIATEAVLRIAPDQWSALLYGDTAHKSHMQSIIDKLQTPQSFAQSVQELFIALQRTGDPAHLVALGKHLDRLASIDPSPDAKSPTWQQLAEIMTSIKDVVSGLIHYLQQQATGRDSNHNQKHGMQERSDNSTIPGQPSVQTAASTPTHSKYKVSMCRDAATRSFCPRGNACTFAHSEEEMERHRSMPGASQGANGNYQYMQQPQPPAPQPPAGGVPRPAGLAVLPHGIYPLYPAAMMPHPDNYNVQPLLQSPVEAAPEGTMPPSPHTPEYTPSEEGSGENIQANMSMMQRPVMLPLNDHGYYNRFGGMVPRHEEPSSTRFLYQGGGVAPPPAMFPTQNNMARPIPNIFVSMQPRNPGPYSDMPAELMSDYQRNHNIPPPPLDRHPEHGWSHGNNEVFAFDGMRNALLHTSDEVFAFDGMRNALLHTSDEAYQFDTLSDTAPTANATTEEALEQELQALERRIDTELEIAD